MKIYLDMDGVLVDFDKGLLENFGVKNCLVTYGTADKDKTPEQWALSKKVWQCMNTEGFFLNLPPMDGFEDLWNSATSLTKDVFILTAFPGHNGEINQSVKSDKLNWLKKHLPKVSENSFIFCERKDKMKYAWTGSTVQGNFTGDGNILIDDLPVTCQEWSEAGGYAVPFKNYKQAIWDMEICYGI